MNYIKLFFLILILLIIAVVNWFIIIHDYSVEIKMDKFCQSKGYLEGTIIDVPEEHVLCINNIKNYTPSELFETKDIKWKMFFKV